MTTTPTPDEREDPVERDLRALLESAGEFDVPEPSPLFWEHQAARISEAIAAEPPLKRWGWTSLAWGGAVAVAVVALLVSRPSKPTAPVSPPVSARASVASGVPAIVPSEASGERAWTIVEDLGGQMDAEAAAEVLVPADGAADGAVLDLDPQERAELANLLRAELKAPRS